MSAKGQPSTRDESPVRFWSAHIPIPAGFSEQIGPHVVTPKISIWNEFPAAVVSYEAGSIIYKGDSQSHKTKMWVFNQVAQDKWGESYTSWENTFFIRQQVSLKKKRLQPERVVSIDLEPYLLNGKLFLRRISRIFRVASKWKWWAYRGMAKLNDDDYDDDDDMNNNIKQRKRWWRKRRMKRKRRRRRKKSCPGQLNKEKAKHDIYKVCTNE